VNRCTCTRIVSARTPTEHQRPELCVAETYLQVGRAAIACAHCANQPWNDPRSASLDRTEKAVQMLRARLYIPRESYPAQHAGQAPFGAFSCIHLPTVSSLVKQLEVPLRGLCVNVLPFQETSSRLPPEGGRVAHGMSLLLSATAKSHYRRLATSQSVPQPKRLVPMYREVAYCAPQRPRSTAK
jgi:hypothetical protein